MTTNTAPKLTAVQRTVLAALASGHYVPVRGGRSHGAEVRCTPSTAIALHKAGFAVATESLRYREGRERAIVTRVAITAAGRAAVA